MESPDPWVKYPDVWPTKAKFFAWLRGGLRKGLFMKYPPKIIFKQSKCGPPPKWYRGKAKKGTECELTGKWTPISSLEVDHVEGHVSLKDWDDLLPFIFHLLDDEFQLLSKEAHKIKSYAERMGISFEEAVLRKRAIAFSKLPVNEQKETLKGIGASEDSLGSAKKRQEAYLVHLREGEQG